MCVCEEPNKSYNYCQVLKIQAEILESQFVYVGKSRTKTCLEQVLDIAQGDSSQVSRTFKLQEKELKFSKAQPIENCSKAVSAEF